MGGIGVGWGADPRCIITFTLWDKGIPNLPLKNKKGGGCDSRKSRLSPGGGTARSVPKQAGRMEQGRDTTQGVLPPLVPEQWGAKTNPDKGTPTAPRALPSLRGAGRGGCRCSGAGGGYREGEPGPGGGGCVEKRVGKKARGRDEMSWGG